MYLVSCCEFRKYYNKFYLDDTEVGKWRISSYGYLGHAELYMDASEMILNDCKMYHDEINYQYDITGKGEYKVSFKRNKYDVIIKYKIIKFEV